MHKTFSSIEELYTHIQEDKEWTGAGSGELNRYPIRFILFENFADFNEFISNRPSHIFHYAIEKIIDMDYPDIFPTPSQVAQTIKMYVKNSAGNDFVIYPFSEMTRFYPHNEFVSLVKTIKKYEPPIEVQQKHLRIYIPLVGMQGKMSPFMEDSISHVWEYKAESENSTYRLILTKGRVYLKTCFSNDYTVVYTLKEWLKLWEKGEDVRRNIICTSGNIGVNAHYAQPDNAFSYEICESAYEFLTKGLKLEFGEHRLPFKNDAHHWEELAKSISIEHADFKEFVREKFSTYNLSSCKDFIENWLDCDIEFDRWLLSLYYLNQCNNQGYICRALAQCNDLSNSELFSHIVTLIFNELLTEESIRERRDALKLAVKHGVIITEQAEQKLKAKLKAISADPERGYYTAVRLLSPLTDADRQLAIEWLGAGKIQRHDIEHIFPELYDYMSPLNIQLDGGNRWICDYFDSYRVSKIANNNELVKLKLMEKNGSPAAFQEWSDNFKTVKTLLHNREDIDVFYWIDGLGVDWIPYIIKLIQNHSIENVYLNEVMVAKSALPTITAINKAKLLDIVGSDRELPKMGDLDSFAHSHKNGYPQYIADELKLVKKYFEEVLSKYNKKKIAFVSDHGLTYMAQFGQGLNLSGIEADHSGRCACVKPGAHVTSDNNYINVGEAICALTDNSLGSKTPKGQGAHGGATPEEVLVPIIIVSSTPNASTFSVKLLDNEIEGTNPVIRYQIKGLTTVDVPIVEYNGVEYQLIPQSNNIFQSERLNLVDTAKRVALRIGDFVQDDNIIVSTGAQEDTDLFDF